MQRELFKYKIISQLNARSENLYCLFKEQNQKLNLKGNHFLRVVRFVSSGFELTMNFKRIDDDMQAPQYCVEFVDTDFSVMEKKDYAHLDVTSEFIRPHCFETISIMNDQICFTVEIAEIRLSANHMFVREYVEKPKYIIFDIEYGDFIETPSGETLTEWRDARNRYPNYHDLMVDKDIIKKIQRMIKQLRSRSLEDELVIHNLERLLKCYKDAEGDKHISRILAVIEAYMSTK